jgi:antitoxin HicB
MALEQVYKLPLVLEPQPEGGYVITCPLIPNLITEADTLDQVQAHVADALAALIEIYEDLGQSLPQALQPLATSPGTPIWAETLISVGVV